jgi:hypothetical protein
MRSWLFLEYCFGIHLPPLMKTTRNFGSAGNPAETQTSFVLLGKRRRLGHRHTCSCSIIQIQHVPVLVARGTLYEWYGRPTTRTRCLTAVSLWAWTGMARNIVGFAACIYWLRPSRVGYRAGSRRDTGMSLCEMWVSTHSNCLNLHTSFISIYLRKN